MLDFLIFKQDSPVKEALVGLETEYAVHLSDEKMKSQAFGYRSLDDTILCQVPKILGPHDYLEIMRSGREFWLRNGIRFYMDSGHPEVATAECGTFSDLIFQKNVGDALMEKISELAREELRRQNYWGPFDVYANNTAFEIHGDGNWEVSFARHENYLLKRSLIAKYISFNVTPGKSIFLHILENIGIFFAARPVLGGSGHITGKGDFVLSPRAALNYRGLGALTTSDRALINTRDEPHADPIDFLRYHHIAGDTNITDHITQLKVAFTYWVLRLLEIGWLAPSYFDVSSEELIGISRYFNFDPNLKKTYQFSFGPRLGAVDILKIYLEAVDSHKKDLGFEEEDEIILAAVGKYLDRASLGPEAVSGESEWATKYCLMRTLMDKKSIGSFDHRALRKLSIVLHKVDKNPETNYYLAFRNKVLPPNIDIGDLAAACRRPPRTRAFLRGLAIYLAKKFEVHMGLKSGDEWACLAFPLGKYDSYFLAHHQLDSHCPWEVRPERVKSLMKRLKSFFKTRLDSLPPDFALDSGDGQNPC